MLTSVEHHNIEALLGFCVDGSEMILVTDNICNNYLDDYLGNVNRMCILTWENRLKICIDVARLLDYLHSRSMPEDEDIIINNYMNGVDRIIINNCINRNNILLDENLKAKIVFLPPNRNDEDTGIQFWKCGKDSYIDPKYKDTDILQRQSDVYSFGVVLFEILCGKKANDQVYFKNNKNGLAHVVRELVNWETLEKMIDPIIMKNTSENILVQNIGANRDSLSTFIKTAYYCVAETDDQHPTMRVVIKQLEEALSFQVSVLTYIEIGFRVNYKNLC
ncbi:hypothetical protein QVD17_24722 [Tagetes erecta]|uniref:Protein kinase domain-containing protein n=1 Tax=Tagetes erecta TaxID=13708 RepID=A0AAD8KIW8_TARER|nr:hypothetical protein QVD17_24722 [Tagetes erecta]